MMKNNHKKIFGLLFIISVYFLQFGVYIANAAMVNFTPLAPLPNIPATGVSLSEYIAVIFKIGLGLAGVFAVLMIVIAGIEYIGGASKPSTREDARKKIWNAIWGLIIALIAWLLLNAINPNLLKTGLNIQPTTATSGGSGGGGFGGGGGGGFGGGGVTGSY
jgi:uncharacterized membrane protein YgcG